MERIVRILVLLLVSLFVGLAFTCLEPYPYRHSTGIWAAASLVFLAIEIGQRSHKSRIAWNIYGLAIFGCSMLANIWFWWGKMENGWWYPPQLPIVQQFYFPQNSEYDALVANFFLTLWFLATACFAVYQLWASSKRRKVSTSPVSEPVQPG